MGIEIRHVNGTVLFTSSSSSVSAAVREAVAGSANLRSADLYGANLGGADLYGANLGGADLYGANLYGADLRGANLRSANLYGANLGGADLYGANLYGADLRSANLRSANLYGANLGGADLRSANLRSADLYGANLGGANLRSANLYGANLGGADLYGANLYGAKNLSPLTLAQSSIVPEEGSLIGWKKAGGGRIVKLKIPASAKRSNSTGRKCRASKAKVLAIYAPDGSEVQEAVSTWDDSFVYRVGKTAKPCEPYEEDRWRECAPGIHFFITRAEAEDY